MGSHSPSELAHGRSVDCAPEPRAERGPAPPRGGPAAGVAEHTDPCCSWGPWPCPPTAGLEGVGGGMVSTCSAAEQPLWSSAVSMSFCFSSCKAGIWGPLPQASRENEGIPLFIPEPGIRPSRTLTAQASLCSSYLFPGCLSFPGSCLCPFFCFPRPWENKLKNAEG